MLNDPENEKIGLALRLKEAREYVGLSQDEVAQILKVPRTAISQLERGERKVDALELKRLSALYRRNIDYFTGSDTINEVPQEIEHLARTASKLSPKDIEELTRFAQFLQSKTRLKEVK